MDSTEEFWVETMQRVFLDQHLPKGKMQFQGQTIDCTAITDIPLLTLEGENDDMIAPKSGVPPHQCIARRQRKYLAWPCPMFPATNDAPRRRSTSA